jgi:hypothetical protein
MIYKYIGSFDDKVQEYPWAYCEVDSRLIEETIFRPAIFPNETLLINDGYILLNTTLRRQLLNPNSPLRAMFENGLARVISRGHDNPRDIVESRAASGVQSFARMKECADWSRTTGPALASLKDWDTWTISPPAKDLSKAFAKMILRLRDRKECFKYQQLEAALQRCLDDFQSCINDRGCRSPRTDWEHIVNANCPSKRIYAKHLMGVANEAYHVAMAACLAGHSVANDGDWFGVETRVSAACIDFIDAASQPNSRSDRQRHSDIVLSVPEIDHTDGGLVRDLIEGGMTYQSVSSSREAFHKELSDFLSPHAGEDDVEELRSACDAYSRSLSQALRGRGRERAPGPLEAFSALKDIITGDAIGLFCDWLGARKWLMQILRRRHIPVLEGTKLPIISAPLNQDAVKAFVAGVPDYGT